MLFLARTYLIAALSFSLPASEQIPDPNESVGIFLSSCGLGEERNTGSVKEVNIEGWIPVNSRPPFIAGLKNLPFRELAERDDLWLVKRGATSNLYLRADKHIPIPEERASYLSHCALIAPGVNSDNAIRKLTSYFDSSGDPLVMGPGFLAWGFRQEGRKYIPFDMGSPPPDARRSSGRNLYIVSASTSKSDTILAFTYIGSTNMVTSQVIIAQAAELSAQGRYEEAADALEISAERDDPEALTILGDFYIHGWTGVVDTSRAASFYERASSLGYPRARFNLAVLYRDGVGVKQDYVAAAKFFEFGAKAGDLDSQVELGWLYFEGKGVPLDPGRAVDLFRTAADQHNPSAQYGLGLAFYQGRGVRADRVIARSWMHKAAAAELSEAKEWLAEHSQR